MQMRFPYKVGGTIVNNIREFIQLADEGNAEAQNKLGECFFTGMGVPKDLKKSTYYTKLALAQDNTQAMINMGFFYAKGITVDRDTRKAEELYLKAYSLGDTEAAAALTQMYMFGMGLVKPNVREGFKYLKEAYDHGYSGAKALVQELGSEEEYMEVYELVTNPDTPEEVIQEFNCHFLQFQPSEYKDK